MNTLNDLYLARPDLKERIEEIRREQGANNIVEDDNLFFVMLNAFEFMDTKEGHHYWWDLAESLDT